jgi:hypothetical protein
VLCLPPDASFVVKPDYTLDRPRFGARCTVTSTSRPSESEPEPLHASPSSPMALRVPPMFTSPGLGARGRTDITPVDIAPLSQKLLRRPHSVLRRDARAAPGATRAVAFFKAVSGYRFNAVVGQPRRDAQSVLCVGGWAMVRTWEGEDMGSGRGRGRLRGYDGSCRHSLFNGVYRTSSRPRHVVPRP